MPNKRQAGVAFLFGYFLFATQRESNSVAEGDRPLLILDAAKPAGGARPTLPLPCEEEVAWSPEVIDRF
ncbi:MAG: hypothetical protein WBA49_15170 [Rhodanobacter lindaniclasticus]